MSIGKEFLKQTSYQDFSRTGRRLGDPQPPLELPYDTTQLIPLPAVDTIDVPPLDLRTAIERRRSIRAYAQTPLTPEELSYLLWCTQGIQQETVFNGAATLRTVPSSGAKHAFETFLGIQSVEGLEKGLYRYVASQHALQLIKKDDAIQGELAAVMGKNTFAAKSAVLFVWAAVIERMFWHHGDRGYRNLFLDAGHIGQNLYLAGQQVGCGACGICVFDDAKLNTLLGIDGEEIAALYAGCVGKQRNSEKGKGNGNG
jgi:SagB-type dehydrogenase family enzyme